MFFQLDLALKNEDGGDISSFITNGEWDLIGKHNKYIFCSFFPNITYLISFYSSRTYA